MIKLEKEEIRIIQLNILKKVAQFCEERKIKYWIDFGTLLGAIRHKGYIPWDDDIDIGMLREDYERLKKTFNVENSRYKLCTIEADTDYFYACGKVVDTETVLYEPDIYGSTLSVNIDVFAYDNVPDKKKASAIFKKNNFLNLLNVLQHNMIYDEGKWYKKTAKALSSNILKIFPNQFFLKKIQLNAKKYNGDNCESIGSFVQNKNFICSKSLVNSLVEVEFENELFKAPKNYDKWLQNIYKNYMELPPEENRVSHHKYEAYMK